MQHLIQDLAIQFNSGQCLLASLYCSCAKALTHFALLYSLIFLILWCFSIHVPAWFCRIRALSAPFSSPPCATPPPPSFCFFFGLSHLSACHVLTGAHRGVTFSPVSPAAPHLTHRVLQYIKTHNLSLQYEPQTVRSPAGERSPGLRSAWSLCVRPLPPVGFSSPPFHHKNAPPATFTCHSPTLHLFHQFSGVNEQTLTDSCVSVFCYYV